MNKPLMEQLELEKIKRDILKEAQNNKKSNLLKESLSESRYSTKAENQFSYADSLERESDQKFAWEYELERYRKDKLKDRFYFLGMCCGILALILTLYFNASEWLSLF